MGKNNGGTGLDISSSVAVDSDGNVYTAGTFQYTVDFDPGVGTFELSNTVGNTQTYVQKLDSAGNFIWAKAFGGTVVSIEVDNAGNIYTAGYFVYPEDFDPGVGTSILTSVNGIDIFVQKMDGSGNFLWARSFGGPDDDYLVAMSVDASGNVYTTGNFWFTVDFDPGPDTSELTATVDSQSFVQKMDSSGNFVWVKQLMGSDCRSSIIDHYENIHIAGRFAGTMDFDPGPGTTMLTSVGSGDVYVQKMDSAGNFIWARSYGGTGTELVRSIGVDSYGNIYTSGEFDGTADFDTGPGIFELTSAGNTDVFVQKMDSSGNFIWARAFEGIALDVCFSMIVDTIGNVYTTGLFGNTVDFDGDTGITNLTSLGPADAFVNKMDSSGNLTWVTSFGGNGATIGQAITLDGFGNVYTTGKFSGLVDFNTGLGVTNANTAGSNDVFVHKMNIGAEVKGYVFIDGNSNGVMDQGELPVRNQSITYANGNYVAITTPDGSFRAFPAVGMNTFHYDQVPNYYTNTTALSQSLSVQFNVIDTLYFGIEPVTSVNDLKVQIHPVAFPRPGFSRNYQVDCQNVGTTTLNNVVLKFLKSPEDDFVSASGSYSVSNDTLIWNLSNLQPFSYGVQTVQHTLSITATIGDSTHTQAWVTPTLNDSTPINNAVVLTEEIGGSYDPNDKNVIPSSSEPSWNEPLDYTIRFQNTGNYQADFVIIEDTLSPLLDLSTFEMVAASHSYELAIANRVATWTFAQINLPDSTTDEPGSHGFVKFRMKRVPGLGVGTQIPNAAAIYFDYNEPIITNTCVFSIETVVGVNTTGSGVKVVVYPNPTTGTTNIKFDQPVNNIDLAITDLLGQVTYRHHYNTLSNVTVELPNTSGVYFLSITTPLDRSTIRLIKE